MALQKKIELKTELYSGTVFIFVIPEAQMNHSGRNDMYGL